MVTTCRLCGGVIGPDITERPMCYGCGPAEMAPPSVVVRDGVVYGRDTASTTMRDVLRLNRQRGESC